MGGRIYFPPKDVRGIMDNLIKLIKELIERKFYGSLEIKFENGKVIIVRRTENIKL
jgi:hypothetical protein